MSTGFATIPLLKAAPEAEQIADRLEGGVWKGIELCLAPAHVADDAALARAVSNARDGLAEQEMAVTAEAPVAWPSGAFVTVAHLDREARAGIERSARFAAEIGSPVLTIHLFAPQEPQDFRAARTLDEDEVERFLRVFAESCTDHGVTPLIENVPPVLRMRTGGVYLSSVGGHWRDLLEWRERVPQLRFTIDTSHAALFANFAASYPSLFSVDPDDGLELNRYVEELGPAAEVAHVSNAAGLLGEGLPYGEGEIDLDPVVARLGQLVPYIVAEINEPDPGRSPAMKEAYGAIERALATPGARWYPPPPRLPSEDFDWQAVVDRRDPVPAVLELEQRFAGASVLLTGGGGSIGRALTTFLLGLRPRRISVLDAHEASLAADRRERRPEELERVEHVLCDVRDAERIAEEVDRAAPDAVFHLAAYKHVDWAERYPQEFAATNLEGSWNVLQAAAATGARTVVVASTDKAALAASLYGRTKRLMESLAAAATERGVPEAVAVRLVNVLGSAGSASDLFLRQARAGVPLTVTDTGMVRYWITMAHAVALLAHGAAVAAPAGVRLAAAADPVSMTVGELAQRIWREAGGAGEAPLALTGVRPGETMTEVITGPGEELVPSEDQACWAISAGDPSAPARDLLGELDGLSDRAERTAAWLAAVRGTTSAPAAT
jgi:nucleoside-diphosphate-sugar epimerase/sugar phosphate isomerase/epimerase